MITKLIHREIVNLFPNNCNGLLEYKEGYEYNLEKVPHQHLMVCMKCWERIVADSEELYGIVDGIKYQLKLQI